MEYSLEAISLERIQNGDKKELNLFFHRFYPLFIVFAQNFVEDRQACEDIVQEAFVAFWEKQHSFKNIYYVRAFLYRSVRNKCLNHIRHQKNQMVHIEYEGREKSRIESNSYFIDTIIQEESSRIITEALQHLSPMGRGVLKLAIDGLSNKDIAEKLGISINTVRTHKARSYQYLRLKLSELRILLMFFL